MMVAYFSSKANAVLKTSTIHSHAFYPSFAAYGGYGHADFQCAFKRYYQFVQCHDATPLLFPAAAKLLTLGCPELILVKDMRGIKELDLVKKPWGQKYPDWFKALTALVFLGPLGLLLWVLYSGHRKNKPK